MTKCGICGCESDKYAETFLTKRRVLDCPCRSAYPEIHELVGDKQNEISKGILPKSVIRELEDEVKAMQTEIQNKVKNLSLP